MTFKRPFDGRAAIPPTIPSFATYGALWSLSAGGLPLRSSPVDEGLLASRPDKLWNAVRETGEKDQEGMNRSINVYDGHLAYTSNVSGPSCSP